MWLGFRKMTHHGNAFVAKRDDLNGMSGPLGEGRELTHAGYPRTSADM